MSHSDGRLTYIGRRIIIEGVLSDGLWPTRPRKLEISRTCVNRWLSHYRASCSSGPADRISCPHHWLSPTRCEVAPLPKGLYLGRFRCSGLIPRAYCLDDERHSRAERDDEDQDER